ncbi:hypothetical protein BGZ83_003122, partial [Gryganskiella cystojenkinii]
MSSDVKIYESLPTHCYVDHQNQRIRISITDKIVLAGDVKMMLWYDNSHLCHFYFNTTFIEPAQDTLFLMKSEIDKACKDKLHTVFDKNMSIQVHFGPALAQQSPLPTLDSLPNRAILLKYKNHEGPNSVQVSPPFFSTVKLSPPRNASALKAFSLGGPFAAESGRSVNDDSSTNSNSYITKADPGVAGEGQKTTPPNSSGSTSNSNHSNGVIASNPPANKNIRSPVLIHSKAAFKPVRDLDRDRDDNWDAASISSDISESDAALEWWYTQPPRPTLHSTTGTAATASLASIVQPEHLVRGDPETSSLVFCDTAPLTTGTVFPTGTVSAVSETRKEVLSLPATPQIVTSLTGHLFRSPLSGVGGISVSNSTGSSTGGIIGTTATSPATAYRSPPHSATSPLAREIKYDTDSIASPRISPARSATNSPNPTADQPPEKAVVPEVRLPISEANRRKRKSSIGGSFLNENGETVREEERDDSGVESLEDSLEYGHNSVDHLDGCATGQDRGWVGSMSRWLWSGDGNQ